MKLGFIHLSLVPVRKEPDDRAEMVNQLLFGEGIRIMEKKDNWTRVKSLWDDYSGWIDSKQFLALQEDHYSNYEKLAFASDPVSICETTDSSALSLVLGSTLPGLKKDKITLEDYKFNFHGSSASATASRDFIVQQAQLYLNAPYLWGGRSPFGIDCSGFTQMVYKMAGIRLKRDASQQAKQGRTLSFIEEAQPGDLAFFHNPEGKITHVGLMLENNHIIHASGRVKIDKLDHQGIFNLETGTHSHKLRLITNIID